MLKLTKTKKDLKKLLKVKEFSNELKALLERKYKYSEKIVSKLSRRGTFRLIQEQIKTLKNPNSVDEPVLKNDNIGG